MVCADLTFSDAFAAVDLPTSIALTLAERTWGVAKSTKRFVAEKADCTVSLAFSATNAEAD